VPLDENKRLRKDIIPHPETSRIVVELLKNTQQVTILAGNYLMRWLKEK
jgi:hypothetical protein